jgi:hypothetical protein
MATAMHEILSDRRSRLAIMEAVDRWEDHDAAEEIRRVVRPRAVITDANWGAMLERAGVVADTLEAIAFEPHETISPAWRLDTATMIRVRAGGVARRGGPLEWKGSGSQWSATSPRGTRWDVFGPELFVGNWDRPDWLCRSSGEAKRVAEEIEARPKYPLPAELQ